ncbi:Transcriptional regulatory protein, C terminal [Pseudonocardia thermophila]|uniref:Transcriptional regulatory protein, C terminal n=1 Tax=Pseudonocardia thermophila TaxID=1848 RepID=A0A1M6QV39_PSETH|nr:AfsR/SARP family transcriptional regulator [Pseudonocardia thermophila]SHK24132.1 Transcriptional regulatory protein, C terminal [Pseudonocardia thermophila]
MLSPVRVDVLGTLRAFRGGEPVELAGRKQRQVLAALALHGGRPVSVDALVDLLWGDAPPPSAVPTLQVYVAGLRRALEPDRPARTRAQVVVTVTPGYALRLPDGALDAARFCTAVTAAHQRLSTWAGGATGPAVARPGLSAGELVEVVGELDAALASWRGIPYVELGELPAAVAERARLAELRMVALEDRAAALLALGRHATVAAELEALTAEHPLRERLWLLRVMALAGADRQADGLQALRQVRRILADELGLDPGAALQELEGAILRRDPAVVGRSAPVAGSPARPAPARPLPGTDLSTDIGTGTADPRSWPLVGRAAELAELEELLAVAARGIPQFAVLVGEPGIGKTRLGQELAARAREHGFTVLVGRCSEEETAPPLWPWAGVLRGLQESAESGSEQVRADLAEVVALFSPAPDRSTRAAGAFLPDDADASRFLLWSAVARVLVAASGQRPLLVIIEDLHWADPSSLRLLCHLAEAFTAGRILVLATRRAHPEPTGVLARACAALARRHATRLDLAGLSVAETAALVEAVSHRAPDPGEAERLRERTEGNPFFVVELVRLLATGPAGDQDLPAAVTDVIARRVAHLPADTRDLLRTASVIGRRFDLAPLAAASGCDEEGVLDALDPALAAGVIAEEETVDRFRFAHALVRDAVYAELPKARRARRHAAVARALEAGAGPGAPDRRSEIAAHWLAAGPAHAAEAWRAAAAAAERARRVYAHEEAATLLQAALDAQRADVSATSLDRYALLLARADACRWSADRKGVDAALVEAVAEAERAGDLERMARAAVGVAEGALWQIRDYGQVEERMVAVLRRASQELPPHDSELRCRVLIVLAGELYYGGSPAYREASSSRGWRRPAGSAIRRCSSGPARRRSSPSGGRPRHRSGCAWPRRRSRSPTGWAIPGGRPWRTRCWRSCWARPAGSTGCRPRSTAPGASPNRCG